jgi:hypothetical protein
MPHIRHPQVLYELSGGTLLCVCIGRLDHCWIRRRGGGIMGIRVWHGRNECCAGGTTVLVDMLKTWETLLYAVYV